VVAVNLFSVVMLLLREVQGATSLATNPQLVIVDATFDAIEHNADDLAAVAPSLIGPTLRQLESGASDPLPVLLLDNVRKLRSDLSVFESVAHFFRGIWWIFGYVPIAMSLLFFAAFLIVAKPTLLAIVTFPERAARGDAALRGVLRETFSRIGRELL